MSIDFDKDSTKATEQQRLLGLASKMVFGSAPPEELQKLIDKAEAAVTRLQAIIDDPTVPQGRKNMCKLSLEQETTMLEMYRGQ